MNRIIVLGLAILTLASCSKRTLDFMVKAPSEMTAPAEFEMVNQSQGFDSYEWYLGDGSKAMDSIISHRYYLSGKYTVTLEGTKGKKKKRVTKDVIVSPPEACLVRLQTEYGDMLIELYDETPLHRDNFLKLADGGFFDSLLFHRVIDGFMLQGGDPQSKLAGEGQRLGTGGPGYQVDAEFRPELAHTKGALAAARTGGASNPKKRSSGSQFYIVQGKPVTAGQLSQMEQARGFEYTEEAKAAYLEMGGTPFLDQDYTVFGRVIEGLDVIDKIAGVNTDRSDRPLSDVRMYISVIK